MLNVCDRTFTTEGCVQRETGHLHPVRTGSGAASDEEVSDPLPQKKHHSVCGGGELN